MNSFQEGQKYEVAMWINTYSTEQMFDGKQNSQPKANKLQPDFVLSNQTFTMSDPEWNNHELTYDLDLDYLNKVIK